MRDLLGESILDLKYYWWRRAEIRGIPVVVTRTGWTSEVGYEIYLLDTSRGTELWDDPDGGRQAVRRPPDRAVRHPPHRGRHLQLGRRHDLREQRLRDGPRPARRPRPCRRRRRSRSRRCAGSRRPASTRRIVGVELDGAPLPGAQQHEVAGVLDGGSTGRARHVGHPLAAAGARTSATAGCRPPSPPTAPRSPSRPSGAAVPPPSSRCRSSIRTRGSPSHDHPDRAVRGADLVDPLLRPVVSPLAVLRADARRGLLGLRHLQPHVPAGLLRRPDRGVLAPPQRGDRLGRQRRADRRDHRAGRLDLRQHA